MEEICKEFRINGYVKWYIGIVVLTDEAMFLCAETRSGPLARLLFGGLIGYLLLQLFRSSSKNQEFGLAYDDLPIDLRQSPLIKHINKNAPWYAVPRDGVTSIKFSKLSGVTLKAGKSTFVLSVSPLSLSRVSQALQRHGWDVASTAEPVA